MATIGGGAHAGPTRKHMLPIESIFPIVKQTAKGTGFPRSSCPIRMTEKLGGIRGGYAAACGAGGVWGLERRWGLRRYWGWGGEGAGRGSVGVLI